MTFCAMIVPHTGGRIGRKVLLGVLSRGYEIASGGRPTCGLFSLAAIEMVMVVLIFGWISAFIRFLGVMGQRDAQRASSRATSVVPVES